MAGVKGTKGLKAFDRKFGPEWIAAVPREPGVYRMTDAAGRIIYVGKAKNLFRRLSQYRNAKRCKHDRKMLSIVKDAAAIAYEVCPTELAASLLEARLIQELRPRWNVAGAFSFLYPMIGARESGGRVILCLTTLPESFPGFAFHGAYRSREIAGEGFFALMRLLKFLGHPVPRRQLSEWGTVKYSYVFGFRQLPAGFLRDWEPFFRGDSCDALEGLCLALLENAGARARAAEIEDDLRAVRRFWRHEARRLWRARAKVGYAGYPVPQQERDLLFLRYKAAFRDDAAGAGSSPASAAGAERAARLDGRSTLS